MVFSDYLILEVVLACSGLFLLKKTLFSSKQQHPPLPPGPKRKAFIGNLLDLPKPGEQEWVHWTKHKDLYGPMSSISIFGQHIVVINEMKLAFEMLDKKSSLFSDRPVLQFAGVMCGYDRALAMITYGERFRALRKYMHQYIGTPSAMVAHHPLQEIETRHFLRRLMAEPDKLHDKIRTATGSIILKMSHGYTVDHEKPDPLVQLADDALAEFSLAAEAGKWMVDVMPFLRSVPDWFPGTGFKRVAADWRGVLDRTVDQPHAFVKQQMASGHYFPSFTSAFLEDGQKSEDEDYTLKWAGFALYGGGADTTVSSLYSFFLAMTLYPEVQKAAQEELDRVVGSDRLPSFADRENLPYINALVKETLRWNPVVPLCIPHTASEDAVFNGYFIPKGTIILPNIWQFTHDSTIFHDPKEFKPERFLGAKPEFDPHELSFGFGRRICPGKELADASIYIAIAQVLSAFDIGKGKDASGNTIEPLYEYTPGVISHPKDFLCSVTPRSDKAAQLVKSVEFEHPAQHSDAEVLASVRW